MNKIERQRCIDCLEWEGIEPTEKEINDFYEWDKIHRQRLLKAIPLSFCACPAFLNPGFWKVERYSRRFGYIIIKFADYYVFNPYLQDPQEFDDFCQTYLRD